MLNFLLIYLNLVNLENQSKILSDIQENTEIALVNQELGLNATAVNHDMLDRILVIQGKANQTIEDLNVHMHQANESLRALNVSFDSRAG